MAPRVADEGSTKDVRRPTQRKGGGVLGERGVVDLVGLLGHYSLVAMTLNTFEVPVPDGAPSPFAGSGGGRL